MKHVKALPKSNSAIPEPLRGTFEGTWDIKPAWITLKSGYYLRELLPVHWFPDDQHLLDKGLKISGDTTRWAFCAGDALLWSKKRYSGIPRYGARFP